MADSTRDRILDEALRLFADQGYAGTSVAAIEAAAGLSPHSGALYTHFGSKEQVMSAAVERAVATSAGAFALAPMLSLGNLTAELTLVARGSLMLLHLWRNLIRVMTKESDKFPAVMAQARERLFAPSRRFLADWLAEQAADDGVDRDVEAITAIWQGALENYWAAAYLYDDPPFEMDDERFIQQWVNTLRAALGATP
ncbi:TetR/AcrR family transcriptional regulator [Nocardia sp. NPDC050406]|uniref:TetR/AcrR family transcriptional regulator n=1 Tax=Nocardia sp. NPDC050406 TaxID=3364318 RepID=UPI0037A71DF5